MTAVDQGYEFFEHTADVGIRATAPTLSALFIYMAQGLTALIAEDSPLQPRQPRAVAVSAQDPEELLLAWLQTLLFWFSTERFLPVTYQLDDATRTTLRGQVTGDTFDPARHVQGREVKAITRHRLEVRQDGQGWSAQVIVDV